MKFSELPAIGAPLEGGTFAGVITKPNGIYHAVVRLNARCEYLNWSDAKAWAKEQGGELPTRFMFALIWSSKHLSLTPEWYWSADEFNATYAWRCFFGYSYQSGCLQKANELTAVAVRLIELEGC